MLAAAFCAACVSYGGAECGCALHAIDSGLDCASQVVVSVQNAAAETTVSTRRSPAVGLARNSTRFNKLHTKRQSE